MMTTMVTWFIDFHGAPTVTNAAPNLPRAIEARTRYYRSLSENEKRTVRGFRISEDPKDLPEAYRN